MKYSHILNYVASTPWAIHPTKLAELLSVLAFRASGGEFTAEEIQARIGEPSEQPAEATRRGAVAVIPVRGVIAHRMGSMTDTSGGTSCERIDAMIDRVAGDPNISTIVYDFDTPGGTVPGVQETAARMFALRGVKRQVAHLNGMAASAGYWMAAQCDEIISIPSGTAGSIGVFTAHQDLSKLLEKEGVSVTLISAGKFKTEGNQFEPLTDEAREFLQARVDAAYAQFVKDVARGRGVAPTAIRNGYGEGRALSAKDALAAGLIDRIATFDETIARLTGRARAGAGMRAEDAAVEIAASADAGEELPLAEPATMAAAGSAFIETDRRRRLERF